MRWAYGITTVPSRRRDEFNRTVESLRLAGFDQPWIFVDGCEYVEQTFYRYKVAGYTFRNTPVRVVGNWILSMWELYIRNPDAERYAIFQDDMVTYKNLKTYLERVRYPQNGYLNLYTFRGNEDLLEGRANTVGFHEGCDLQTHNPPIYHGKPAQKGAGAVALVFNNEAVRVLLSQESLVDKPLDLHNGWRRIDGAIVTAMNMAGWREYIHNPSLVQHTGDRSTIGNYNKLAQSFRGEDFDCLSLLSETVKV